MKQLRKQHTKKNESIMVNINNFMAPENLYFNWIRALAGCRRQLHATRSDFIRLMMKL